MMYNSPKLYERVLNRLSLGGKLTMKMDRPELNAFLLPVQRLPPLGILSEFSPCFGF